MNKPYKIVIMTASVGSGHDQAANAMRNHLLEKYEYVEVEVIDFIDILSKWSIGSMIKSIYLKMIEMLPSWYHLLYQMTMKLDQPSKVTNLLLYKYTKRLKNIIDEWQADMILFTNPVPSIFVSQLKRQGKLRVETGTIITDYAVHGVWMDESIDHYFVGSHILKSEMMERGVSPHKIHAFGIPIDDKFKQSVNKNQVLEAIGMKSDLPTVLIMGGGLGLGSVDEILSSVEKIQEKLQLIVVTGKNHELKQDLEMRLYKEEHLVKVLGFCDNIHELMSSADLLISKSGGLTITEAITKELPMLIFDPIPGQEVENANYLSSIGVARYLKDSEEIQDSVYELLFKEPLKLNKMKKSCSMFKQENAASNIGEVLLKNKYPFIRAECPIAK